MNLQVNSMLHVRLIFIWVHKLICPETDFLLNNLFTWVYTMLTITKSQLFRQQISMHAELNIFFRAWETKEESEVLKERRPHANFSRLKTSCLLQKWKLKMSEIQGMHLVQDFLSSLRFRAWITDFKWTGANNKLQKKLWLNSWNLININLCHRLKFKSKGRIMQCWLNFKAANLKQRNAVGMSWLCYFCSLSHLLGFSKSFVFDILESTGQPHNDSKVAFIIDADN